LLRCASFLGGRRFRSADSDHCWAAGGELLRKGDRVAEHVPPAAGLGATIAAVLARHGAAVAVTDLELESAREVAARIVDAPALALSPSPRR
jgi:hypothetical protein